MNMEQTATQILFDKIAKMNVSSSEFIEVLRENKDEVDFSATNSEGRTLLGVAVADNHHEIVKYLIEECGVDINQNVNVKAQGLTALHMAAQQGHIESANVLVDLGADVNAEVFMTGYAGATPLIFATRFGYKEIVKKLCQTRKIDTSKYHQESGQDALCVAISKASQDPEAAVEMIQTMIRYKAVDCNRYVIARMNEDYTSAVFFKISDINELKRSDIVHTALKAAIYMQNPQIVSLIMGAYHETDMHKTGGSAMDFAINVLSKTPESTEAKEILKLVIESPNTTGDYAVGAHACLEMGMPDIALEFMNQPLFDVTKVATSPLNPLQSISVKLFQEQDQDLCVTFKECAELYLEKAIEANLGIEYLWVKQQHMDQLRSIGLSKGYVEHLALLVPTLELYAKLINWSFSHDDIISWLKENKDYVDFNSTLPSDRNFLSLAVTRGDTALDLVNYLLDECGVDVNHTTQSSNVYWNILGLTALQVAARYGYREIAKTLLDHGAKDVKITNPAEFIGYTALTAAAESHNLDLALMLFKKEGFLIHNSSENLNHAVMQFALQGMRILYDGNHHPTILSKALEKANRFISVFMESEYYDPNAIDAYNMNPLLKSVQLGLIPIALKILKKGGVDLYTTDLDGNNVLKLFIERISNTDPDKWIKGVTGVDIIEVCQDFISEYVFQVKSENRLDAVWISETDLEKFQEFSLDEETFKLLELSSKFSNIEKVIKRLSQDKLSTDQVINAILMHCNPLDSTKGLKQAYLLNMPKSEMESLLIEYINKLDDKILTSKHTAGMSVLQLALFNKAGKIVDALLKRYADLHKNDDVETLYGDLCMTDSSGSNIFHYAAEYFASNILWNRFVTEIMLPRVTKNDGNSTRIVGKNCQPEIIIKLLNQQNNLGDTPLHLMFKNIEVENAYNTPNQLEKLKQLLSIRVKVEEEEVVVVDINIANADGLRLIDILCMKPMLTEALEIFMKQDPEIGVSKYKGWGCTAMHLASSYGNKKAVELLHDKNKQLVKIQDSNGKLPLHYAAKDCQVEMFHMLKEMYPGSLLSQDKMGLTPLHHFIALSPDREPCVNAALELYNPAIKAGFNGPDPVEYACALGNLWILSDVLVDRLGLEIPQRTLNVALSQANLDVAEYLMVYGLKLNAVSDNCVPFLELLYCFKELVAGDDREEKYESTIKTLAKKYSAQELGLDHISPDVGNKTARDLLTELNMVDIIALIESNIRVENSPYESECTGVTSSPTEARLEELKVLGEVYDFGNE